MNADLELMLERGAELPPTFAEFIQMMREEEERLKNEKETNENRN